VVDGVDVQVVELCAQVELQNGRVKLDGLAPHRTQEMYGLLMPLALNK